MMRIRFPKFNLRFCLLMTTLICVVLAWQNSVRQLNRFERDERDNIENRELNADFEFYTETVAELRQRLAEASSPEERERLRRYIAHFDSLIALLSLELAGVEQQRVDRTGLWDLNFGAMRPSKRECAQLQELLVQAAHSYEFRTVVFRDVTFPTKSSRTEFNETVKEIGAATIQGGGKVRAFSNLNFFGGH